MGLGTHPDLFRPAIARLDSLNEESLRGMVNSVPVDWISRSARDFAFGLMSHNLERLQGLIG